MKPTFRIICTDRGQHRRKLLETVIVEISQITDEMDAVMRAISPRARPGFERQPVGMTYVVMQLEKRRSHEATLPGPQIGPDHVGARTWRFRCTHHGCPRDPRLTEQDLGAACRRTQLANPGRPHYDIDMSYAD